MAVSSGFVISALFYQPGAVKLLQGHTRLNPGNFPRDRGKETSQGSSDSKNSNLRHTFNWHKSLPQRVVVGKLQRPHGPSTRASNGVTLTDNPQRA